MTKFNQKKYDKVKGLVFGTNQKDMDAAYKKKYGKVPKTPKQFGSLPSAKMTTTSMGMKTTTPKKK